MALSKAKQSELNEGLIEACQNGDLEEVKELISQGADIHDWDDEAICKACQNGNLDVVKVLIEKGADIHAQNEDAIGLASQYGHADVVKILIENGADVHANDGKAIVNASENGDVNVVKLLHQNGADLDKAILYADDDIKQELINYKNFGYEKDVLTKDLEPLKQTQVQAPSRRI